MTLPFSGLVEPMDGVRDRVRVKSDERGVCASDSGPGSPRSINSAPCGMEDHHVGPSRLGLALPLGMTHSSPTASPQHMEWKVKDVMISCVSLVVKLHITVSSSYTFTMILLGMSPAVLLALSVAAVAVSTVYREISEIDL